MQEVGTIKGAVVAWISNYYLSKNIIPLVQFAYGQYVLN
jgi:hypothetical protein